MEELLAAGHRYQGLSEEKKLRGLQESSQDVMDEDDEDEGDVPQGRKRKANHVEEDSEEDDEEKEELVEDSLIIAAMEKPDGNIDYKVLWPGYDLKKCLKWPVLVR